MSIHQVGKLPRARRFLSSSSSCARTGETVHLVNDYCVSQLPCTLETGGEVSTSPEVRVVDGHWIAEIPAAGTATVVSSLHQCLVAFVPVLVQYRPHVRAAPPPSSSTSSALPTSPVVLLDNLTVSLRLKERGAAVQCRRERMSHVPTRPNRESQSRCRTDSRSGDET